MGYTTAIFDMVVTDMNAPSYHHMRLEKALSQQEVEKKRIAWRNSLSKYDTSFIRVLDG